MSRIDARLKELGLLLPPPLQLPSGAVLPFPWVRVVGVRALISGHGPSNADGSLAEGSSPGIGINEVGVTMTFVDGAWKQNRIGEGPGACA